MGSFEDAVRQQREELRAAQIEAARQTELAAEKNRRVTELLPEVLRWAQIVGPELAKIPSAQGSPAMDYDRLTSIIIQTHPRGKSGGMSGHSEPPSMRKRERAHSRFTQLTSDKTFRLHTIGSYGWWERQYPEDEHTTEHYGLSETGSLYQIKSFGNITGSGYGVPHNILGVVHANIEQRMGGDQEERLQVVYKGLAQLVAAHNIVLPA